MIVLVVLPIMAVEVPSEPSLQHQISTVVQYYIPGGHSDRRGRGELCTGRGSSHCALSFFEHVDGEIVEAHNSLQSDGLGLFYGLKTA